jgi:hypothetical protein
VTKTLEATIDVEPDGAVRLELSEDLPPGHHHGVLILTNGAARDKASAVPAFRIEGGGWPEGYTASRSQLYGYDED